MDRKWFIIAGVIALVMCTNMATYATTSTYNSKGRIEYDANGNGVFTDDEDVVFDSRDITTLDTKINTVADTLNAWLEGISDNISKLVASDDKFEYVLDDTGEIIGYKTDIGGDTVFSFNEGSYGSGSEQPDSYTISLTVNGQSSGTYKSYLSTSGKMVIPTFGATKLIINSVSGCTVTGDVTGSLGNNSDISNDTTLTISHSTSTVAEDSQGSPTAYSASSITLTLVFE